MSTIGEEPNRSSEKRFCREVMDVLKGVSQKVIEVVGTDHKYFEKAILFLRPSAQQEDRSLLDTQAGEYLSQLDYRPRRARPGVVLLCVARLAAAALLGAGVACAFFLL